MCGRYSVFDERDIVEMKRIIDEVDRRFALPPSAAQSAFVDEPAHACSTGEIFPTNFPPVIMSDGSAAVAVPMYWGFPRYDKKGTIINARIETAFEKPLFRRAMYERRAAVPTTGFYEWDSRKRRFIFLPRGESVAYMAGIMGIFSDGASEYAAFVILTRAANEDMLPVHTRMPVLIPRGSVDEWVLGGRSAAAIASDAPPRLDVREG